MSRPHGAMGTPYSGGNNDMWEIGGGKKFQQELKLEFLNLLQQNKADVQVANDYEIVFSLNGKRYKINPI